MRVSRFGLCLVLIGLSVWLGGCRRQAAQAPAKPPIAPTAPVQKPVANAKPEAVKQTPPKSINLEQTDDSDDAKKDLPQSWNDPRVLAELVKNCAFNPDDLSQEESVKWTGPYEPGDKDSVMSCQTTMEQSCAYDPCDDAQSKNCNPRCIKQCTRCGKPCAKKCETCKSTCQDDDCRMACAKQCADCHEVCVRRRDRCATGTCTEEYKKCRVKLRDEWKAKGCAAICETQSTCKQSCEEKNEKSKPPQDCAKLCAPKEDNGCNLGLCPGDDTMGIDPETLN